MAAERHPSQPAPRNIHDSLFRSLLESPSRAAEFLRCFLPAEVLALLADEPPILDGSSFVKEKFRNRQSDRLFRVKLRSGDPAHVHVLIEHASSPDPYRPLRLLDYRLRISERDMEAAVGKPPALIQILSLVVCNGKARGTVPLFLAAMIAANRKFLRQLRNFGSFLVDLGRVRGASPGKGPGAPFRPPGAVPRVPGSGEQGHPETDLPSAARGTPSAGRIDDHIVYRFDCDPDTLQTVRKEAEANPMGKAAEGIFSQGRAEGLATCRAREKTSIILRQLALRFGPLPSAVRERVGDASRDELDAWLDSVVHAPSLAAVFGEFRTN